MCHNMNLNMFKQNDTYVFRDNILRILLRFIL
jgi:hypothetical protein